MLADPIRWWHVRARARARRVAAAGRPGVDVTTIRIWFIGLGMGLSRAARGQWNAARFDGARRVAAVSVGVDPAVLATAAYGQHVRIGGRAVRFALERSVAAGNADARDFRLRLNAEIVLLRWQSVRATGRLGFVTHLTHLTHTAAYRANFPAAQDGWYLATGGTWRVDGLLGTSFGSKELVLRAGVPRTQGGESLLVPAYATLGVGRSF